MKIREGSVAHGVESAMDFWLSQHPISMGDMIVEAVEKAFRSWLDSNSEELMNRIADKARVVHLKQDDGKDAP